ncbi:MAG: hypothetical protein ACOYL6_16530 [Bacteriovoracaceae bacterium]
MKSLILLLAILLSVTTFANEDDFNQAINTHSKIQCKTKGKLFPKSKILVDLVAKQFNVIRFNRNDDPNQSFLFAEVSPNISAAIIDNNIISSSGTCEFDWKERRMIDLDNKYTLTPDKTSLNGRKFKAKVYFQLCSYKRDTNGPHQFNSEGQLLPYHENRQVWGFSKFSSVTVDMNCKFLD